MAKQSLFKDDEFQYLKSDISKIRQKYRMYISASNELAARNLTLEIFYNSVDECRNPRSPANKINIEFDERSGFIKVSDNGRGIPSDKLELILTTLNSGSNIDSGAKMELKTNVLGRNGTGTLAFTALAERIEVTSYRGGTENIFKKLTFAEGEKIDDSTGNCDSSKHGLEVYFKPSKILGKDTRIVWEQIRQELLNFQFLESKRIKCSSLYITKDGIEIKEDYKVQDFTNILTYRNSRDAITTDKISLNISDDNVKEEFSGKVYNRFINMDIAFAFTNSMTPYIDSFCNGNNTIDNGTHLDAAFEALCRYFQQVTKSSMSEKEREKLDIKWDDIKNGMSVAVTLNSNMEHLFTSQTKQKVQNTDLEKLFRDLIIDALHAWGDKNANQLREFVNIVKMNAKARREGDKVRTAVMKESVTNWSSFKMKNYDPCSNRGKEYKELYIIEGD